MGLGPSVLPGFSIAGFSATGDVACESSIVGEAEGFERPSSSFAGGKRLAVGFAEVEGVGDNDSIVEAEAVGSTASIGTRRRFGTAISMGTCHCLCEKETSKVNLKLE